MLIKRGVDLPMTLIVSGVMGAVMTFGAGEEGDGTTEGYEEAR